MRLKNPDGPLSIHKGNNDILNSPKRINTVHNSNISVNYGNTTDNSTTTTTNNYTNSYDNSDNANLSSDVITNLENLSTADLNILNQVVHDKVQWCKPSQEIQKRTLYNNANNRNNQLVNINTTLAATIRQVRHGTASSICSESSPDDSLLDFEEAQPSCSSTDTSPQEEDRVFDVSDSESSEDGNLCNRGTLQRRGIINPNYPGFQHFAYSLNFRTTPDADLTDDDIECDTLTKGNFQEETNNNNIEETDYKIDSVNRLDSVENIQKVFYEKQVFNLEEEGEFNQISDSSSRNSNHSDEDTESGSEVNTKSEEKGSPHEDIVGDLSKEIEDELGKVVLTHIPSNLIKEVSAEVKELEVAVENLQVMKDLHSAATKYNIEPNIENNFDKLSPTKQLPLHQIYEDVVVVKNIPFEMNLKMESKIVDAILSNAKENISPVLQREKSFVELLPSFETKMEIEPSTRKPELYRKDSNRELEDSENHIKKMRPNSLKTDEIEKFCKEDVTKDVKEKEEDIVVPRKKEKVQIPLRKRKDHNQQVGSWITVPRRELTNRNKELNNRKSVPMVKEKKRSTNPEILGGFDVYNIETAMPKIDLEAIESHLRAAHEEDRRRRTDREEIRRRLAMGNEDDYFIDRPGRKPSLQARLQSGMNLQICFMNETLSDTDSPSSDSECPMTNPKQLKTATQKSCMSLPPYPDKPTAPATRPATLSLGQPLLQPTKDPAIETDFFTRQARLQTEARMALAQAKEMARMQMEIERQRQKKSPITEMIRHSLEKVGIPFPEEKRRLSRQILTEMNVAQLQVIVNDLHTQIETLNENLVKFLMDRDDLHMEQDSMLVDIEDLTRYLGAKEQVLKEQNLGSTKLNNNTTTPPSPAPSSPLTALNTSVKPHLNRIASLVKK